MLTIASVDWVIIPFVLEPMNLSSWTTFWIAAPLANSEVVGWFYFWKWFAWEWLPKREKVEEAVEFVKSVVDLLREHGLLRTITIKALWTFRWATVPKRVQTLKKWGHFWMFFLGAEPFFSGGRLLGVISCAVARWKVGLISLCMGNVLHVYISIKTWKIVFYFWEEYRIFFVWATVLSLLGLLFKFWFDSKKNQ